MEMQALVRRGLIGLCGAVAGVALMTAVSRSDEVSAHATPDGLTIHGPEETLRDFCRLEDGALWLVLPSGSRFELVTEACELPNPGDGSFHPFDEAVVRSALEGVRYPLGDLAAEIFLLPYPRRSGLQSAAGPGLILLSPGVTPITETQQHASVVHELGHVIQYQHMPDEALDLWGRYRGLRGITDEERYDADAPHRDRPHEIFAEDFRALFGGALATYSGTIENPMLCHPGAVEGLEPFLASLGGSVALARGAIQGFPNPTRGALSFRRGGAEAEPLDVFDLAGRRVATVTPTPLADGWTWRWDGRDRDGQMIAGGVMFARERGGESRPFRFVVTR
jgi:hypothetical protein